MVEQIRISPEEVRGYGNICEEHSLDDFIVSSSGLAKEKENIHGALTEVYKLVYSLYGLIFDFDKGAKQLYLHSDYDVVVVFSFSEKSLVFNTVSHISFAFADKELVVDDENYLFVDYGVTGNTNSNWVKVQGTDNKTVTSTGTTLANTTSTRYDIFANLGSTSSVYDFTSPFTVEVDIIGYVGTTARLQVYDATNNQTYNGASATGHWKIIVDGTTVKPYKDGVEQTNFTRNIQTARIGFFIPQNCSITYKNFVIY